VRSFVGDLGVNEEGADLVHMHCRLNEILISEVRAGRRVVVVIDEAQNLADSVLEAVRMLSNFEYQQPLFQCINFGFRERSKCC